MNIYDFSNYVNQDVDDTFSVEEIARWFNKAIANYNLILPITKYPFITMDYTATQENEFVVGSEDKTFNIDGERTIFNEATGTFEYNEDYDDEIGAFTNYPLSKNFMLAVMLPYVSSAVKSQESSVGEKQMFMQEFLMNAATFKSVSNIKYGYMKDGENNKELSQYRLGQNVYLTDFNQSPFAGDWNRASAYKEFVIKRKQDGTIVKYVDDSLVDEDIETMAEESEY